MPQVPLCQQRVRELKRHLLLSHTSEPIIVAAPGTLTSGLVDHPDPVALAQHHGHFIPQGTPQPSHPWASGIHASP